MLCLRAPLAQSTALAAAAALALIGCSPVPAVGTKGNLLPPAPASAERIRWPARYAPERATFFVTNAIEIDAPPRAVWDVIVAAEAWPAWYEGARDVAVPGDGGGGGVLGPGVAFTWRTMDLHFTSTVHEFDPPYRLAWESRRRDIQGYHAWLLIPTPAGGTRLVTDESQFGLLAVLQKVFIPRKLKNLHDAWLAAIKARAEDAHGGQAVAGG